MPDTKFDFGSFGLGCGCYCEHWCGHCTSVGRLQRISEANPICLFHGQLGPKDVITAYPEGHDHNGKETKH